MALSKEQIKRLESIRVFCGESKASFAKKIGISRRNYYEVLYGHLNLTPHKISCVVKLAKGAKLSVDAEELKPTEKNCSYSLTAAKR